jgi:hypothetical protein
MHTGCWGGEAEGRIITEDLDVGGMIQENGCSYMQCEGVDGINLA